MLTAVVILTAANMAWHTTSHKAWIFGAWQHVELGHPLFNDNEQRIASCLMMTYFDMLHLAKLSIATGDDAIL